MEREELFKQARRLAQKHVSVEALYAEACEFLRVYAGPNSSFYVSAKEYNPHSLSNRQMHNSGACITAILNSFAEYAEAGLNLGVSPERQAQLDVVSDFLEMAAALLDSKEVHPATAAVLVGASLEEFLRNWVEAEKLSLAGKKPGLESYSQLLREADLITKQDGKDITSWAGLRNHAAHGEWHEVAEKGRISLMLEGVNLFMRKYTP